MLSMEQQPRTWSRENQRAVVARAALQGHFFLLYPEHIPAEELVALISPQDSRRGTDPLSVCVPPDQPVPKATVCKAPCPGSLCLPPGQAAPLGPRAPGCTGLHAKPPEQPGRAATPACGEVLAFIPAFHAIQRFCVDQGTGRTTPAPQVSCRLPSPSSSILPLFHNFSSASAAPRTRRFHGRRFHGMALLLGKA